MKLLFWSHWPLIILFLGAAIAVAVTSALPPESVSPIVQRAALIILAFSGLLQLIPFLWNMTKPDGKSDDWRAALIRNVRRNWIDGVLADALRDAQFEVDLETRPEQAARSDNYINHRIEDLIRIRLNESGTESNPIPATASALAQAFHHVDGKLLILGEPGSGKTVLLLQLAKQLLDDAEQSHLKPIPVVVNLSSWAVGRKPIVDWLAAELVRTYGLNREAFARKLIDTDQLIFLLDGLDEVAEAYRDECLEALNTFMTVDRKIVVCSRIEEYNALTSKLDFHTALEVQPLSFAEFEALLRKNITNAETVDEIISILTADEEVRQEAVKPLFANILISTYRDGRPFTRAVQQGNTITRVRHLLIEPYIARQLQRTTQYNFSNQDTRRYLEWLAWNMQRSERTTFYVEELQPNWLLTLEYRYFHNHLKWLTTLFIGVLFGFLIYKQSNLVASGIVSGLFYGLFFKLFFDELGPINLMQKTVFSRTALLLSLRTQLVYLLAVFLALGLFCGIVSALHFGGWHRLPIGLVFGLLFWLLFWVLFFQTQRKLDFELRGEVRIADIPQTNQGLWQTLQTGLFITLLVASPIWLGGMLVLNNLQFYELAFGLFFMLFIGLIFGLDLGLNDVIKHLYLRYLLWRTEVAPRRFDHFLYHARDLRLMRQVGGGFIFIHRYIQEYFAAEFVKNNPDLLPTTQTT